MKLSFRWYGQDDKISLDNIRQIPDIYSIVSAVYDTSVGEVWSRESIANIKKLANEKGLAFEVVESVPVHEDIKLGLNTRVKYIEAYKENIRRLGEVGVKCICYNFMPIFDWTRTQLDKIAEDGSNSLVYYQEQLNAMNPIDGELSLPGWDASYKKSELKQLFENYAKVDEEKLFCNLKYFLEEIIPIAEECKINMAIHADDPPWSIFGLPRIITNEKNIDRMLKLVDSKNNGLTFCTGSLGASLNNDLVHLADKYAKQGRIHFAHIRNIKIVENGFEETAHSQTYGSLDIIGVLKALADNNFDGYIRPDHGRMIWGETGKYGYGLYDRAIGASYINGIWQALKRSIK